MASARPDVSRPPVGGLCWLALSALVSLLIFLAVRLLFGDAAYGIPLLISVTIFSALCQSGIGWNVLTVAAAVATYMALYIAFGGASSMPLPFLVLSCMNMFITAVLTGALSSRIRKQQRGSIERGTHDRLVAEINTLLLTASTDADLYRLTLRCLFDITQCAAVFYFASEEGLTLTGTYPEGLLLYPTEHEAARAACDTALTPGHGGIQRGHSAFHYMPVRSNGHTLAVIGILVGADNPPDAAMLETLGIILVRVGVALEKQRLAKRHQSALLEKELEQMRSDFLRAISHDFRTPLTGIIAACSALSEGGVALDPPARDKLIGGIGEEAAWLLRMVENLLSVTRVGSSGPQLHKSLEPVEEVLSETMERVRKRFPHTRLHMTMPGELLMIPMDPILIVQVLMNLIENAVKYSGDADRVELSVTESETLVSFTVRDYGAGLSPDKLGDLFAPASLRAGDSTHGMGLGLSICRSIIHAHGGAIEGANGADGGAVFTFTLPKEDAHE